MAERVHTFVGTGMEPVSIIDPDMDEGAPPPMPQGTARPAPALGESRTLSPEDVEMRRAAAAQGPLQLVSAPATPTGMQVRLRCLELAAASGHTDPGTIMQIARTFLDFLTGG